MAKRKTKSAGLADSLREAIRDCGLSARKLGEEIDVDQPTLSAFLSGKDIRLMTAQKLMDYFKITATKGE
ncbi:MAG: XRE family transcriptional regulator [Planctomycetaceae bacterium]|nr:XRE family transcriptional regulator [Planctomycetaceae bacterium]